MSVTWTVLSLGVLAALVSAVPGSSAAAGPTPEITHLEPGSLDLLRSRFNAESDKVRAVLLASPV